MIGLTIARLTRRAQAKMQELDAKGGRDINLADEVDALFREIGVRTVAEGLGWSELEIEHALHNLDIEYGDECVITLANGREIRCPAYPETCSYVRVTQAGCELGFWVDSEWQDDPDVVMGALLGLARGGSRAAETDERSVGSGRQGASAVQVSLDGGRTLLPAPEGVRVLYAGMPGVKEDDQRALSLNATDEGLILDVWETSNGGADRNLATQSETAQEIIDRLVG